MRCIKGFPLVHLICMNERVVVRRESKKKRKKVNHTFRETTHREKRKGRKRKASASLAYRDTSFQRQEETRLAYVLAIEDARGKKDREIHFGKRRLFTNGSKRLTDCSQRREETRVIRREGWQRGRKLWERRGEKGNSPLIHLYSLL